MHTPAAGERRVWTQHDRQCRIPNPRPGTHPDGYPECSLIDGHHGDCDYTRHAAAPAVTAAAQTAPGAGAAWKPDHDYAAAQAARYGWDTERICGELSQAGQARRKFLETEHPEHESSKD